MEFTKVKLNNSDNYCFINVSFVLVPSRNPIRYTYLETLSTTKSNWSEKSEKSVKESKSRHTFCYESDVILNTNNWLSKKWKWNKNNRPFPSSLVPLFRSESKCKTFHMKMSSACSFIFMHKVHIKEWFRT